MDRIFKYYEKLDQADRTAFVAALIGELVTLKVMGRRQGAGGGRGMRDWIRTAERLPEPHVSVLVWVRGRR